LFTWLADVVDRVGVVYFPLQLHEGKTFLGQKKPKISRKKGVLTNIALKINLKLRGLNVQKELNLLKINKVLTCIF